MITFVNDERQMTTLEARRVYKGLYLGFLILNQKSTNFDEWSGRVLYTAETYFEQHQIPTETKNGQYITTLYGMGVKDLPMGGVTIIYDKQ